MIDRRTFLAAAPISVFAAGCLARGEDDGPTDGTEGMVRDRRAGVGVQLYTLRDVIAADLDAALGDLARIGYEEVELFQLHGQTPAELRARLDGHGLRAVSSHYGLPILQEDLGATVAGALELGQRLMVVPSLAPSQRTAEALAGVAEEFNRIGDVVRRSGMRFGYHNHDWEFLPMEDGVRPIDILLDRTDPDLVDWQMDIFWTVHGGADPFEELARRAGRVTSVHVKDRTLDGEMVDVGDGVIDFVRLLAAAEEQGLEHAFVEHDTPADPMGSVRRSFEHLQAAGVVG